MCAAPVGVFDIPKNWNGYDVAFMDKSPGVSGKIQALWRVVFVENWHRHLACCKMDSAGGSTEQK